MKLTVKNDRMEIEVEGEDAKAVFESIASAQEVFSNTHCGACDSDNTMFVVRKNGKYTFHEMRCRDCGCTLAYGQKQDDGSLFPKRKDKEGNRLDNGGWTRWQPKEDSPF